MANDFIQLNRDNNAAIFAGELVSIPRDLANIIDRLERIQQKGFRMFVSNPVDFSGFETRFGVPTGKGQAVFDLINGTLSALKGEAQNANAMELINAVG